MPAHDAKLTCVIAALLLLAALTAAAGGSQDFEGLPEIEIGDLDAWGRWIRPREQEAAFEEIDWIADFAGGLRAAQSEQKPLLFWAMNGHPLGCT